MHVTVSSIIFMIFNIAIYIATRAIRLQRGSRMSTYLVRLFPQGHFSVAPTFICQFFGPQFRAIFCPHFQFFFAPTNCPWVSEDAGSMILWTCSRQTLERKVPCSVNIHNGNIYYINIKTLAYITNLSLDFVCCLEIKRRGEQRLVGKLNVLNLDSGEKSTLFQSQKGDFYTLFQIQRGIKRTLLSGTYL